MVHRLVGLLGGGIERQRPVGLLLLVKGERVVGEDAAHLGGGEEDVFRPLLFEEFPQGGLVRQVEHCIPCSLVPVHGRVAVLFDQLVPIGDFEILAHHLGNEFGKGSLGLPAEFLPRLRGIAQEGVDLRGTEVPRIDADDGFVTQNPHLFDTPPSQRIAMPSSRAAALTKSRTEYCWPVAMTKCSSASCWSKSHMASMESRTWTQSRFASKLTSHRQSCGPSLMRTSARVILR